MTRTAEPPSNPPIAAEDADEFAHQLSQPLAAIVNYARGCQLRIKTNMLEPQDLERALENIVREALRAGELVRARRNTLMER
jgi:two-component system sensor histidine kinase TtrS